VTENDEVIVESRAAFLADVHEALFRTVALSEKHPLA
jgi:hypothetical protein